MGKRGYPPEFRRRVLDLLAAGRRVPTWPGDRGELPGLTSTERSGLAAAKPRIGELEADLAIHRRASELLVE